jgi:SPP1 family predicted phage head-tail adaptor
MRAGDLDKFITIKRATTTTNAFNEKVQTWSDLVTRRHAMAQPVSDAERFRAGETLSTRKYRFTIRYSANVADVDPRDRIEFEGRIYDINGVKEVGRREGIEFTATARAEAP